MIKKNILLFFLAFIFIISCNNDTNKNYISGKYYENVYKADSLFIIKDYGEAFKILDSLFDTFSPVHLPIYEECLTYTKLAWITNHKSESFKSLKKLISNYGYDKNYIINDGILKKIYNQNKEIIDKEYEILRNNYLSNIDLNLRKKIIQMREADQLYRGKGQYGVAQEKIDSVNEVKMIEIFSKYGYPNRKIVGDYKLSMERADLGTILLHTSDSIRINFFAPKILSFIKEGKCSPLTYGAMIDQYLLYNGEAQKYGTYTKPNGGYSEIANIEKIDSLRESIGLPKLGYEDWRTQKLYPELSNYTKEYN